MRLTARGMMKGINVPVVMDLFKSIRNVASMIVARYMIIKQ